MNFFNFLRYLKYLLISRHIRGHGIHSPFVFDLVSKIFRNKINPDIVLVIENIRKKRSIDKQKINITDLGVGSVRLKDNVRKVSEIAVNSAVQSKYCYLLANMAREFGSNSIVELGTSLGFSTMYMAAMRPDSIVYTIEGCPVLCTLAKENFNIAGLYNIELLNGSFDDRLPELIDRGISPGLVFIDGNHRKDPVLRYFKLITGSINKDSVVIIDDIHLSGEMEAAWSEIRKMKNVSFTIDIFRMGIVFFRQGMNHFDYIVRY
jgi:predicted O-methyltransferase YrrM